MSGHTPGPWTIDIAEDDPYGDIEIGLHRRHLVCRLPQDDAPVHDYNRQQWANARLIAAAPDLLRALVAARGCVENAAVLRVVEAAIAKALGEGGAT